MALYGLARLGSDRAQGYAQAMTEAGLRPAIHHCAAFDWVSAFEEASRLLRGKARPTAIFAFNDLAGLSVLRAAADLGIAVPKELAVVAYDDIADGQFPTPRLTTVAQPTPELGREAVTELIAQVEGTRPPAAGMRLLTPQLIIRENCGFRQHQAARTGRGRPRSSRRVLPA